MLRAHNLSRNFFISYKYRCSIHTISKLINIRTCDLIDLSRFWRNMTRSIFFRTDNEIFTRNVTDSRSLILSLINFPGNCIRRKKLSPGEMYSRIIRISFSRAMSHRWHSREQVSPVFRYARQVNHRVLRVISKKWSRGISFIVIWKLGYTALSFNYGLPDEFLEH